MGIKDTKRININQIIESKNTGKKLVFMSVPDYTSARWAEMGLANYAADIT